MKAIILCAGRGERLMPLTQNIPKPMIKIKGKPILWYNISLCKKYGISDIAVNTSYLPEKIKDYFEDGKEFGVNIVYSYEPELLGTSGALNNFRDFLDDDFIVIYGDCVSNIDFGKMLEYHKKNKPIATIALRKKPKEYKTQSLILADEQLNIINFLEKPSQELVDKFSSEFKLINSGIYILSPKILAYIRDGFSDFGYNIFPLLIEKKEKIKGFMIDEFFYREIGTVEKYMLAKKEVEQNLTVI